MGIDCVGVAGLMNDFFMDFLVHATDGEFGALGGGDAFSAVPSFGLMQVPEMRALQRDVFAKVVKHKSRGHAFLLGSRSHVRGSWGCLLGFVLGGSLSACFLGVCVSWVCVFLGCVCLRGFVLGVFLGCVLGPWVCVSWCVCRRVVLGPWGVAARRCLCRDLCLCRVLTVLLCALSAVCVLVSYNRSLSRPLDPSPSTSLS